MNVAVGVVEGRPSTEIELLGKYTDTGGKTYDAGRYRFDYEMTLSPASESSSFAIDDVTIGIGFHWERKERQVFRGGVRVIKKPKGFTVVNDVSLEEYVTSVISSEMSASCPLELLKAHAVISRSWMWYPKSKRSTGNLRPPESSATGSVRELIKWYGREAHADFDVCADDHCQRYQGITKAFSPTASEAAAATAHEMLLYNREVCDARFSKCCGGLTEQYETAWEDVHVPYLVSFYDGPPAVQFADSERWIRSNPPAYCNTQDKALLARILPGFDQETQDFYRWKVEYNPDELSELLKSKLRMDFGRILNLEPLDRGPSGRIYRLKITGARGTLILGKELEIRRALSTSHLYSSAFVVDRENDRFILRGAGWGHGVGLCQIGAAVMAEQGKLYREILKHYYPGTSVGTN
jgi:stage II sporulation protein D